MNQGKYVFAQIFEFVPHNDFLKFVKKYGGDRKPRHFSCWNQFLCMAFGQLTHRESLSDTVMCIGANTKKLYHLGIGRAISKSTLSRANKKRDWRIYRDLALFAHIKGKRTVQGRQPARGRYKGQRLHHRLLDHRPMPEPLSLGQVP